MRNTKASILITVLIASVTALSSCSNSNMNEGTSTSNEDAKKKEHDTIKVVITKFYLQPDTHRDKKHLELTKKEYKDLKEQWKSDSLYITEHTKDINEGGVPVDTSRWNGIISEFDKLK